MGASSGSLPSARYKISLLAQFFRKKTMVIITSAILLVGFFGADVVMTVPVFTNNSMAQALGLQKMCNGDAPGFCP
jgi:hypothetical protein